MPETQNEIQIHITPTLKTRLVAVQKRSGETVPFDVKKIFEAIKKAVAVTTEISDVEYFYKLGASDKITKIPNVQKFIMGLLNIKGNFTTIVDLEKFMNIGETQIKPSSIVIILQTQDYKIGCLADKIGDRINIQEEIEKFEANKHQDPEQKFINFVRDEEVYTIINAKETFKIENFQN